jgi:16S rRNA (guanine527-N7)-methyltransferase
MLERLLRGADHLGITITPDQAGQFQLYYEELVEWNKRVNLTAITSYEEVQTKHFLDSLALIAAFENMPWAKGDFALIDVGTGAGIPGIPLKIVLTKARVVLLDSVAKKTAFAQHAVEKLGLRHVEVVTARAEELARQPAYREAFHLVVCRAVSKLASIAELALPFCRKGGLAVIPKKGRIEEELTHATKAIDILGGRSREIKDIQLEGLEQHCLVVLEKTAPTPQRYPRRTGIPEKRPIS